MYKTDIPISLDKGGHISKKWNKSSRTNANEWHIKLLDDVNLSRIKLESGQIKYLQQTHTEIHATNIIWNGEHWRLNTSWLGQQGWKAESWSEISVYSKQTGNLSKQVNIDWNPFWRTTFFVGSIVPVIGVVLQQALLDFRLRIAFPATTLAKHRK